MKDGGPAFPFHYYDFQPDSGQQVVREQDPGMSLRDYIAVHALAGLLANSHDAVIRSISQDSAKHGETQMEQTYPRLAFEHADAVLALREKAKP